MMWKLIFIGLIVWFAIHFLKKIMRQSDTSDANNANTQATSAQNKGKVEDSEGEDMVRCATCAVHLPRSEAFLVNGNFYCSLSHIKK